MTKRTRTAKPVKKIEGSEEDLDQDSNVSQEEEVNEEFEEKIESNVGRYWKTNVHITGFGTVHGGQATEEQLRAFLNHVNPETDLNDWLSDTDTYTEAVKKMKKKKPANPEQ